MSKSISEAKEGLWQQILANPKAVTEIKDESHVIALGYPDVGKSSIIRSLQQYGSNDPLSEEEMYLNTNGIAGIDNGYINVRRIDDDDDLTSADIESQINLWILQSPAYKDFLKTHLRKEYLTKMAILIFLDLSNPWNLMKHLNDWFEVLDEILEDLLSNLDLDSQDQLKEIHKDYVINYKKMATHLLNATSKSLLTTDEDLLKEKTNEQEEFYNLGVPIIVVICKSDSHSSLEAGQNRDQMDIIIAHLRKMCLSRAATLIFCNFAGSKAQNVLTLYQYLAHRIYGFPLTAQATTESYSTYFLPSGWDSHRELQEFVAKTSIENFNTPFEMLITRPISTTPIEKNENYSLETPSVDQFLYELLNENANYGLGENLGLDIKSYKSRSFDASPSLEKKPSAEKSKKVSSPITSSSKIEDLKNKTKEKTSQSTDAFFEHLKTKIQNTSVTTSEKSKREKPTVLKDSVSENKQDKKNLTKPEN